jgi:peptidoglycan/xylan/chitin deacetylase (PgdA/CDA1 family)
MYIPPTSSNVVHLFCKHPVLLVITIVAGLAFSGAVGCITCNPYAQCDNKSLVTFTFDDGYLSVHDVAQPILEEYGYTAVAFIPTDFIGKVGYMTDQVIDLQSNGWEIGSHSKTHRSLLSLSEQDRMVELTTSKETLSKITMSLPSGFSSPLGEYDDSTISDIKSAYSYQRTCDFGYNDISPSSDVYRLKSMVVRDTTTVEEVKGWIDYAYENNKWLILTFHKINEFGEYNWPSENLDAVAQYLHDKEYSSTPPPIN